VKGISSKNINLLPIFVVIAAVGALFGGIMHVVEVAWIAKIANQKPPNLVEAASGESLSVFPIGSEDRSSPAIKEYVLGELGGLFDWTGNILPSRPGEPPQKDPGVKITSSGNKIASGTWQAGFGLAETFRRPALERIALLTPPSIFEQNSGTQVRIIIGPQGIGSPQKIAPGKWKVPVVATLIKFENGDNLGVNALAFNKDVFVEAVDPYKLPTNPTPLDWTIFNARKAGLLIYSMPDLNLAS